MKLLVILLILKLYDQISIFKYMQERFVQGLMKLAKKTDKNKKQRVNS